MHPLGRALAPAAVLLVLASFLSVGATTHVQRQKILETSGPSLISALNDTLDGRVQQARPLAYPCFEDPSSSECVAVKNGLLNEYVRSDTYNGFMNMQGEACSSDPSDQCLLDPATLAVPGNATCGQGAVSRYYVEVQDAADVQAIFEYAKQPGAETLSIKNTGVDHSMRSSRKGSLAIWTHGFQGKVFHDSFMPQGCSSAETNSTTAITLGTALSISDSLIFAHEHGYKIATGNDARPATGGGWALNGGHGNLATTYGLGADNLVEVSIVTPDGQLRIVNQCQDSDLFWALRGAGGGAFGVVLNVTIRAYVDSPVTMGIFSISNGTPETMRGYSNLLAENLPQWALLGWGGASNSNLSVLANPILSNATEAAEQLAAAVSYVQSQPGGSVSFTTFPSFFEYFTEIVNGTLADPEPISSSTIYTSRIVPVSTLANEITRTAVIDAVLQLGNTTELTYGILANMPLRYGRANPVRNTSLNPAWYEGGLYLVVYVTWLSTNTLSERKALVRLYREATSLMQSVAPDGATYSNEADPWMDGWAEAFWGDNYSKLLDIKGQVDPNNLLSCWHCVGWTDAFQDQCVSGLGVGTEPNLGIQPFAYGK